MIKKRDDMLIITDKSKNNYVYFAMTRYVSKFGDEGFYISTMSKYWDNALKVLEELHQYGIIEDVEARVVTKKENKYGKKIVVHQFKVKRWHKLKELGEYKFKC